MGHGHNAMACCGTKEGLRQGMMMLQQQSQLRCMADALHKGAMSCAWE